MLDKYFRNKEKVLENLKGAYTYYMKTANALDKAANELMEKAESSKAYVKKTIDRMEKFGGVVDKNLLKSYLANSKRNEENARNLMKRAVAFHAAADYVQSVYTIVKYADLGKNTPNVKLPGWVSQIINGDIPSVEDIIVEPPVSMDVYSQEIDDELDSMIQQYQMEKNKTFAEKNDLEKKLSDIEKM